MLDFGQFSKQVQEGKAPLKNHKLYSIQDTKISTHVLYALKHL